MASTPSGPADDLRERCENCERDTLHDVNIEIRTESEGSENAAFSREPYRVAVCTRCESEQVQRMNNA